MGCIKEGLTLVVMDKDTGMLDADDVIGTVKVPLALLDSSASVEYSEKIPEGGVLVFALEWAEGDAAAPPGDEAPKKEKKKKKKEDGPRAEASHDSEKPETTQT